MKNSKQTDRIFSGESSRELWKEINEIRTDHQHHQIGTCLYSVCCKLQELEAKFARENAAKDNSTSDSENRECSKRERQRVDYGDFSEYEVRCLVAEYCMSVTLGTTGWGVPFTAWVELHGIARHDKRHRLIRL